MPAPSPADTATEPPIVSTSIFCFASAVRLSAPADVTDELSMYDLLVLLILLTPTETPTAAARPPPGAMAMPTPPAAARIVEVSCDSTVTLPLVVEMFDDPEMCASAVL